VRVPRRVRPAAGGGWVADKAAAVGIRDTLMVRVRVESLFTSSNPDPLHGTAGRIPTRFPPPPLLQSFTYTFSFILSLPFEEWNIDEWLLFVSELVLIMSPNGVDLVFI